MALRDQWIDTAEAKRRGFIFCRIYGCVCCVEDEAAARSSGWRDTGDPVPRWRWECPGAQHLWARDVAAGIVGPGAAEQHRPPWDRIWRRLQRQGRSAATLFRAQPAERELGTEDLPWPKPGGGTYTTEELDERDHPGRGSQEPPAPDGETTRPSSTTEETP